MKNVWERLLERGALVVTCQAPTQIPGCTRVCYLPKTKFPHAFQQIFNNGKGVPTEMWAFVLLLWAFVRIPRLTESHFWHDDLRSRWPPWRRRRQRYFTQKSVAIWCVHTASARRIYSSVRQFLIHSVNQCVKVLVIKLIYLIVNCMVCSGYALSPPRSTEVFLRSYYATAQASQFLL